MATAPAVSGVEVEATKKGVSAGQRINLDVLDTEQALFRARLDLLTAKYDYFTRKNRVTERRGNTGSRAS